MNIAADPIQLQLNIEPLHDDQSNRLNTDSDASNSEHSEHDDNVLSASGAASADIRRQSEDSISVVDEWEALLDEYDFHRVVFYARLEQIIECALPANATRQLDSPKLFLLALVTDCISDGRDATADTVTYTATKSSSNIIDLNAIQCVVGRLELGVS
jgi:hypothetical protein